MRQNDTACVSVVWSTDYGIHGFLAEHPSRLQVSIKLELISCSQTMTTALCMFLPG